MSEAVSKNHVATFIDAVRELHGVDPPKKVRDRVGAEAGKLVREGVDHAFISRGVVILAEKGLDPSLLPSCVFTAQTEKANAAGQAERDLIRVFMEANGGKWPTGSRFIRGATSGTFKPDVLGYDKCPYPVPWGRPSRADVVAALKALVAAGVDITVPGVRVPSGASELPTRGFRGDGAG